MSNSQLIKEIQKGFLQEKREQIKTGMEVEIHQIIKEWNKERIQKFKGLVIKTAGKSELEKTITVRRKIGAFGVEKIFTIHSPTIKQIDIVRQFKVRKKSIKFIRNLTGKAARLKEVKKNLQVASKKTTKKAPAKKKETKKVVTKASAIDSLEKIEGIGPKIAGVLNDAGVTTFAGLAKMDRDAIKEILSTVSTLKSKEPRTWPQQAQLAADGKWDELKVLQDELMGWL